MQAPSVFHGRYREVGRAAKRIARQLTRGESLSALAPSGIDLRKATGLVLLEGPTVLVGGGEHYHAFALTKALVEVRLGEDRSVWGKAWTQQAMLEPWSLLGLLGQYGQSVIQDEQKIDLLLRVVDYWDAFVALGDRYSRGLGGQSFWSAASTIKAWLVRMGVDVLRTPEPRSATELGDIVRACTGYRIQRCLAARLFEEAVDRSLLEFAAANVARVIANENPAKAGEFYLISARKHVELRKPKAYRESASLVRKARDAYVAAGRPDLGSASIERFRSEYRRFRRLMEALDKEGL